MDYNDQKKPQKYKKPKGPLGRPKKKPKKIEVENNESNKSSSTTPKSNAVLYHCNYCRKDITGNVRIKCAECTDFDLCLECFSVGVELNGHKSNHSYQVMDKINFPLFTEDWRADEELLLLEAVEMYGLGNWKDIADHVGTKCAKLCEDHYFDLYMDSPYFPLPDLDVPFPKDLKSNDNINIQSPDNSPKVKASLPIANEQTGFMPKREEFEIEWENDAEQILTDLAFNDDDTAEEREIKLNVLRAYNQKLEERVRRRQFVIENKIHEQRKIDKRKTREERKLISQMRIFMQAWPKAQHEELIQGLLEERELRRKISEMQNYRRKNCTSHAQIQAYEVERKKREAEQAMKRQRDSTAYNLERPQPRRAALASSLLPKRESRLPTSLSSYDSQLYGELNLRDRKQKPNVTAFPDAALLSQKEIELCQNLGLLPKQFNDAKIFIISESLKKNSLSKGHISQFTNLESYKIERILNYLESQKLISLNPNSIIE
eukprot:TRINITY_DN7671_c2_g1_i1.p1 TRINITY_DN7671_c2_g1~~TRINITY_DN7671_c2_g1_i1.p1  ORF type:complete len:490 (+),score=181.15 TRINITY_DN7671_c2_g1_i1:47-1516(+)